MSAEDNPSQGNVAANGDHLHRAGRQEPEATKHECPDCEKEPYSFWEPDNFYHGGFWTYGCDCEERCGYGSTKERAKEDYENKTA